jgi:anti-sigma factor RsiW
MSTNFDRHIPEEMLDEFVMEMLTEQDCAVWEEHLLICATCQDRVARADEYVGVVKSAAAAISDPASEQTEVEGLRKLAKPMMAAATHAMLLLAIMFQLG